MEQQGRSSIWLTHCQLHCSLPRCDQCPFLQVTKAGVIFGRPEAKVRKGQKQRQNKTKPDLEITLKPFPLNISAATFFLFVFLHYCLPLRHQAVSVYRRD